MHKFMCDASHVVLRRRSARGALLDVMAGKCATTADRNVEFVVKDSIVAGSVDVRGECDSGNIGRSAGFRPSRMTSFHPDPTT